MLLLKRNIQLVVLALAILAATTAAVTAAGDDSNPPGSDVAQVTTIEPAAKEAMTVLERGRSAADALPSDVADRIDERAEFGMNPDLSRRSIGTISNSVYVIPARGHVCAAMTVGQGVNATCATTEQVSDGAVGAATVVLTTGDIGVYGIVPDGVESISVRTGGSDSTGIEVKDNAYYAVVPAGTLLRTVTYAGPSGPVEFPIYDPTLAFEEE